MWWSSSTGLLPLCCPLSFIRVWVVSVSASSLFLLFSPLYLRPPPFLAFTFFFIFFFPAVILPVRLPFAPGGCIGIAYFFCFIRGFFFFF